jgi:hypothetical protein
MNPASSTAASHIIIICSKLADNALREDRILFNRMLKECQKEEYSKLFNLKGEYYSTESLFLALIFQQQKMISQLINKLSKYK